MNFSLGDVVRSTAGKDKDRYFCIVELKDSYCFLRDGKIHKLDNPKRKSFKHVIKTPFKLQGQTLHAMILGFIHPTSGEYIETCAPLPEYFSQMRHGWEHLCISRV